MLLIIINFLTVLTLISGQNNTCVFYDFEDGLLDATKTCLGMDEWVIGTYENYNVIPPFSAQHFMTPAIPDSTSCIANSELIEVVTNGVFGINFYAVGNVYLVIMVLEGSVILTNIPVDMTNVNGWGNTTVVIPRSAKAEIRMIGSSLTADSKILIDSFVYTDYGSNISECLRSAQNSIQNKTETTTEQSDITTTTEDITNSKTSRSASTTERNEDFTNAIESHTTEPVDLGLPTEQSFTTIDDENTTNVESDESVFPSTGTSVTSDNIMYLDVILIIGITLASLFVLAVVLCLVAYEVGKRYRLQKLKTQDEYISTRISGLKFYLPRVKKLRYSYYNQ